MSMLLLGHVSKESPSHYWYKANTENYSHCSEYEASNDDVLDINFFTQEKSNEWQHQIYAYHLIMTIVTIAANTMSVSLIAHDGTLQTNWHHDHHSY